MAIGKATFWGLVPKMWPGSLDFQTRVGYTIPTVNEGRLIVKW